VRVENKVSFKQWVEAAVGLASISDFSNSETIATLKEVEIQGFGRAYQFLVTLETNGFGDVKFALPIMGQV
jgi:hypothetical protein